MADDSKTTFENPLVSRYASKEMSFLWSPQKKFSTWRRLWLALAKAEKELGINITDEQLAEMEAHLEDIDFAAAARFEKDLRHDVMSHVHAWAEIVPVARPIIHLGATSCFVGDNTDLIQLRESMQLVRGKVLQLLGVLRTQALKHKDLAMLGFTHFQAAQPVTLGKRIALWAQDFVTDFEDLQRCIETLRFRGAKGTTGTQASYMELFDGDHEKVRKLDQRVAELMGFDKTMPVTGQTYSRKWDHKVVGILGGIAQSAHKLATDMRLFAHLKEVDEPFGKSQIGSSAMAFKKNPMTMERTCSLARFVMSLTDSTAQTHATQWFERTLDDSANRRLVLPQAFLATDAILTLCINVMSGFVVWPSVVAKHLADELPFMATEKILMAAVKSGGDRQTLHEAIRQHSMEAARRVKEEGAANDLMERIRKDDLFKTVHDQLDSLTDPALFIGRAPEQTADFFAEEVDPILAKYAEFVSKADSAVRV